MKGLIVVNAFLSAPKFSNTYSKLRNAFKDKGVEIEIKTNKDLILSINEQERVHYDFILFYDKDILLARHLENMGYKVINNSKAIEICDDKGLTAVMLENSGILMPNTVIAPFTYPNMGYSDLDFVDGIINRLGLPLVIKESKGSFGEQVYLGSDKEEILRIVKSIEAKPMVFQELVRSSIGKDLRLFVVGERVAAAALRRGRDGDFRANAAQGGTMQPYLPSKEEERMAIDVCRMLNVDFGGVDLLFGKDGPIFLEINSNAHFNNLSEVTGIDIAGEISDYVIGTFS